MSLTNSYLGEEPEQVDSDFFNAHFLGPRGEKYRKCYCGAWFEGEGEEEYCSKACKNWKPEPINAWLQAGVVWVRGKDGKLVEFVEKKGY